MKMKKNFNTLSDYFYIPQSVRGVAIVSVLLFLLILLLLILLLILIILLLGIIFYFIPHNFQIVFRIFIIRIQA